MNKKCFTVITVILLLFSALAPTIALNQTEELLNNTESITNTTMPDLLIEDIAASSPLHQNETAQINATNVTAKEVSIIHVPTDYPTIQEAIDAAPPGSTIFIEDGEYPINDNEHTIRIENKNLLWITGDEDVKLITSSGGFGDLIKIKSSEQITLSGFTVGVEGSAKNKKKNIVIEDSNEITLSDLSLYNYATEGANIEHIPITISKANNCKIEGCKFSTGNDSAYGLIIGSKSKGNIIENNTFNSDTNSIFMGNTTNNILCNNIIHKIWVGGEDGHNWPVVEHYSNNNTIYSNEISSISMQGDNNTIYNNTIISLGMHHYPFSGNNNTIYLNNIFGLGRADVHGNNNWNSTVPVNYTYNGTTFTNYRGNFWQDYNGADNNSDGIGDVPYKVRDSNYDYYPLVEPQRLTFDVGITAITRPYITYSGRENEILATLERSGTYLASEDMYVNLTVNEIEVDSKIIGVGRGDTVVRFKWTPPASGSYKLGIDLQPKDENMREIEMNDTNNGFSIDVAVSPPLFDYADNISSALGFLNGEQLATGDIWGFENSGWAALAITAASEDPSAGRWKPPARYSSSLIEYLRKEPKDLASFLSPGTTPPCINMPEDFARMVIVISAIGEDPTNFGDVNYLTMLKSYYDGEQFGDAETVEDDALAILALVSCGYNDPRTKDMITNASRYIKDRQNEDGGWSSYGVGSDVKTTSIVIQALIAAGENKNTDTIQKIQKALDYLKNAQDDDGGYSDVIATSYAIQALITAGEDPSIYNKTIDYLLSLQQEDGSFNYTLNILPFSPKMTIYPILALCSEPYPVMFKTMREDYEFPDTSVSDIVTEDEICVNTSHTVEASVKSNGGIFYADLLADGEFVERIKVHSVWHDSHTPVSFTWKPSTTGDHHITIFADSVDNIAESDEENNNVTKRIEVVYPDLYPGRITPPDKVFVNVTSVIDCTVKGTTDEHFNVTFEADGEPVGEKGVKSVRESKTISFNWRPPENRTYTLEFTVNQDRELKEREYGNNSMSKSVNVLLPDLKPLDLWAEEEVYVNAKNRINVTVQGIAESFNISLIENGTFVGKTTNVTCYGTENVTVYWKPTTLGNHTITAFVDSDSAIVETNEENNNITDTFEVLLPDLVPEEITPDVLYIDEVNAITVKVNGTAEGFNATLVADEIVDKSGPLCYLIAPIFNGTFGESETILGTDDDCNLTYNITEQRANWSWEDIDTLDVFIASTTSSGLVDSGDTWEIDYMAVVVNYTEVNSTTVWTVELNASDVIYSYNCSNENSTYISDDECATAAGIGSMRLGITDTDAIYGNITSVIIKFKQHVVNAVSTDVTATLKKTNLDTYNSSIAFEWLPMKLGKYNITVFLDSDNNTAETNETNNNMTKCVIVANRIDLALTSPLGGELCSGIQNITWNASYEEPLLIDLFYSPDRGYWWIDIITNETNDGLYAWNTGENVTVDGWYMIKIVARCGMVTAEDQSDIFYIRNKKAGEEWGSFHENAGYAPCDGPDTPEIAWMSEDIGASSSSSLIVARGKVFVYRTGEHGAMVSGAYTHLVALNESSGEELWRTKIAPQELGSWATPAYKDGSVFVSSGRGVYRIDAEDGDIEWEFIFPTGQGSVNGGPAVTRRAIYAGDWDGRHYHCIENNRTKPREVTWTFSAEGHAQSTPAIAYGNVYFGSFCGGECQSKAFCVDAVEGTEIWSTPTGDVCGSVTVADGHVYFTTYGGDGGDELYALNAVNGCLIWKKHEGWSDSTPAYYSPPKSKSTRSYIYVVIVHGFIEPAELHCFDAKTGEEIWRTGGNIGYWTASPIVTSDGKVFVGNPSVLSCLDAFTGEVIWQSYGGPSPVVVNGFVYTVHQGRVIAYGNGTRPDLTVNAERPDDRYIVGKIGNITATIENIGKSNVTESFNVELREKGRVIGERTVEPPVNISNPEIVLFEWTPEEPGEHRLTVEVDPLPGNVSESNPWNNSANVTVPVEDNESDLVTKIEKVSPNPAYVGDTVTVEVNITNIGYETNESFWVRFSVDDVEENMKWTSLEDNVRLLDFKWNAMYNGTYNLTVEANPPDKWTINEVTWSNNNDSREVEVIQPTLTPTPRPTSPGFGPGSRGGYGGGSAGGIGEGSGIGEAGAGEAGGMQIPVNASTSAAEKTKNKVSGFPFGNISSGASGGGGTLPILFLVFAVFIMAVFYFGYYKEKRSHAKHISPGGVDKEKVHKRDKDKK